MNKFRGLIVLVALSLSIFAVGCSDNTARNDNYDTTGSGIGMADYNNTSKQYNDNYHNGYDNLPNNMYSNSPGAINTTGSGIIGSSYTD